MRRAAAEALPGVARAGTPGGVETAVELLGSLMEDASSWVRAAALLAGGVVFSQAPAGSLSAGVRPDQSSDATAVQRRRLYLQTATQTCSASLAVRILFPARAQAAIKASQG